MDARLRGHDPASAMDARFRGDDRTAPPFARSPNASSQPEVRMISTKWHRILTGGVVAVLSAGRVSAQRPAAPSVADCYARAAAIQAQRRDRWVLNDGVVPHWIGDGDQLWYRRGTATGSRYVVVDAKTGAKSDLFDHARLAELLAKATGKPADPNDLKLAAVHVGAGRDIVFRSQGKYWRLSSAGELASVAAPPGPEAVSPDGKKSVKLVGGNLWIRDVATGSETQLTTDAEPYYRYADQPDATGRHGLAPYVIWSPDSKRLLTVQTDDRKTGELPVVD